MAQRMMACLAIAVLTGAVSCADSPVAPRDTVALTVAPATDSVLLTYICGNMFRVRNTSFEARQVRWDIYNAVAADTGSLRLRGRDVGAAHVDYFVTSRTKGTMRVFVGGVLRQTKANGNKVACAAPVDTSRVPVSTPANEPRIDGEPVVQDSTGEVVKRTIVAVILRIGTATAQVRQLQRTVDGQIIRNRGLLYFRVADPTADQQRVRSLLQTFRESAFVEAADLVSWISPVRPDGARYPTDASGGQRTDYIQGNRSVWAANAMRLTQGWSCETGIYEPGAPRIAVMEARFQSNTLSDLSNSVVHQVTRFNAWRPVSGPGSGTSAQKYNTDHSAAVTSILSGRGDNSIGTAGVLWQSDLRLFSLETTESDGPSIAYFENTVVASIVAAAPRVLSLSTDFRLGLGKSADRRMINERTAYEAVVTLMQSLPDLLVVVAAGNGSHTGALAAEPQDSIELVKRALLFIKTDVSQPDLVNRIVVVGATQMNGSRAGFSNNYSGLIDIYAPGERVRGLDSAGVAVDTLSGTSFAAPMVSGIAGQLLTMDPSLSAADVKALLLAGARDSVENSNGINELPRKVGGIQDTVYEADSYGSLRLLSARAGTPLCGAHLRPWSNELDNLSLIFVSTRAVRYQSGVQENLPDFSLSQQSLAPGGRLFAGMSSHLMSFANSVWQPYQTVPDSARRVFSERDTLTWFTPLDTNSQPVMQLRLQPSAGSWNLNPSATASFPFNAHLYGQPSLSPTAERAIVPLTRFGGTINPYGGPPLGFAGSSLKLLSSNPGVSFSLPAVGSRRTLAYEGRTAWDPRGTRAVFYTVSVDSQDVSTQSYQAQTTVLSFNGTSVNATTAPLEPGRWPISAAWSDEGERLTLIDAGHAIVPSGPFVPFTDCRIRNFHVTSSRSLIQLSSGAIDQRSCTYFTALDLPSLDNPARWGVWCLEWSPCQGNSGGNGDDDGSGGGGGGGGGAAGRITRAPAGLRARSIRIPALSSLCRSGRPIVSSSICRGSADPVVPKL